MAMAMDARFAGAFEAERLRAADRALAVRALVSPVALLTTLFVTFGPNAGDPVMPWLLKCVSIYTVAAVALWRVTSAHPKLKPASFYAIPLLDLPLAFAMPLGGLPHAQFPHEVASLAMATFLVMVIFAQISMRPRTILLSALLAVVGQTLVFIRSGHWWASGYAVAYFGAAAALLMYLPRRTGFLVQRILDEADARVREVESLNVELKRQIADRAKQLGDAIARLSTVARPLDAGSIIEDRYRVLQKIGAGGMGAVYEVERISDGKRLALKVLSGVADREALARFAREAQIAAEIDHPNVVSVLDVDVSRSGMLFLVMELVAGSSLAQQRAHFGNGTWARPILRQIAAALAAMHSRGIVHRDLKPANILLDGETAKVADFGIASLGAQIPDGDSTITKGLTRTGAMMGTPMYMAPELVEGARQATPASDVFALGIIAYELLSGRAPFSQPPVVAKQKAAPLDPVVDRCLEFDAARRPSAQDLVEAFTSPR